MLFSSLEFLFGFFPIVLFLHTILPKSLKNYWLFFCSLFFYAWGEPKFVFIMLLSIIANYTFAIGIDKFDIKNCNDDILKKRIRLRKIILVVSVVFNLSILFIFKYMNFTTTYIVKLFPSLKNSIPITNILLPIGISFFTFQALSYVVDVYRGEAAQKNIIYLGLYIALFPQLIAGPIVRYTTIAEELNSRKVTVDDFSKGIYRFLYGFNKKILLANLFAIIADTAFSSSELSVAMSWLGIICYTLQIFYDFSGYSDMAIGLGLMLGFHFLENFDYPYISKTITEFWRRWHISLGSWFRDYLYIPLGGSKVKTKSRLVFNLSVVWLATGIWHGANWTFILWGVLYGLLLIFEKLTKLPNWIAEHTIASMLYQAFTLIAVMLGWVLFRSDSITYAIEYIQTMFGFNHALLCDGTAVFNFHEIRIPLIVGIICSTPLFKVLQERASNHGVAIYNLYLFIVGIIQIILFIVSISYLVINAHNPFIYFNF